MLMLTTITAALRKYSPRLSINLSTVCFRKLYITSLASSPYEISLLKEPQGGFHILSPLSQSVPAWPKPPFHSPFQESCAVIHHLWLWLPSILNTHNCLVFCSTANTEMFCAHFQTRLFKTLKIVFNGTTSFLFSTTAYNNHYPALTKKGEGHLQRSYYVPGNLPGCLWTLLHYSMTGLGGIYYHPFYLLYFYVDFSDWKFTTVIAVPHCLSEEHPTEKRQFNHVSDVWK